MSNERIWPQQLEKGILDLGQGLKKEPHGEAALKEAEARYQAILENIEDGYAELDLSGNITFANVSYCRIFGYSREEMCGINYRRVVPPQNAEEVYRVFNQVYRTGIPNKAFAYEVVRKNGTRRFIEASIHLITNEEGRRIGFRCILRDVTDRREAEEELARRGSHLMAIFRSVQDAIITVDHEMRITEANKSAIGICGLDVATMTGRVFNACPIQCDKSCCEVLQDVLRRKVTVREFKIQCRHLDRPQQMVVVTASPLLNLDGKFMGAVLVIRDITRLSDLERELRERHQFHKIIGKSRRMQDMYALLEDLAHLETTVLISGESGTGKELVARALHFTGNRAQGPLIKVNCSALAENLLESELFGHVKGAFTGAIRDRKGRFQAAHRGTILLDEIGDLSPRIQLKLLRVLEEKEFERVGESTPIRVDVRMLALTHRDLKEKVRVGDFRQDLYYRLKVVEIVLPPLRDRLDDIPLLVEHFCGLFNEGFKKKIEGVSDGVLNCFMNYPWPGNIRELKHTIERAFVLCRGRYINPEHIPQEIREFTAIRKASLGRKISEMPEDFLIALEKAGWNKAKAARLLGIHRRTLYRKISQYNLVPPPEFL